MSDPEEYRRHYKNKGISTMRYTLLKTFRFEAAHQLPHAGDGHKCTTVHGHNYKVQVELGGKILEEPEGWIVDFADIDAAWEHAVMCHLDHKLLNEVVPNPTAELLAHWIFNRLCNLIPVGKVTVWENDDSGASYQP